MIDLFKAMGGEMWGADDEPNRPGTSLHETGVCRFGNDSKTSVTNKWAQSARRAEPLYLRRQHSFQVPRTKTTDDADRRIHDAHVRQHAFQFQKRRPQAHIAGDFMCGLWAANQLLLVVSELGGGWDSFADWQKSVRSNRRRQLTGEYDLEALLREFRGRRCRENRCTRSANELWGAADGQCIPRSRHQSS